MKASSSTVFSLLLRVVPALSVACANSGTSSDAGAPADDAGAQADVVTTTDSTAPHDAATSVPGDAADGGGSTVGPGDATVSDAQGAPDTGGTGAVSEGGIGGANAAIHDDFETGSLSKWTLTDPFGNPLQGTAMTVAIDTAANGGQVHGGMYSVKVHNGGLIGVAPPGPNFYGRFWVWLGTNPSPGRGSGGHWAWAVAPGTLPDGGAPEVRQGGQFDILIDNYSTNDDIVLSDPNLFNDTDGGISPPVGQWICVEFYYGKDSLRTWLQTAEVTALDVTPTTVWAHGMTAPWSPAYSAIRIGYAGYNGNEIDLWVDDVAIDTNRIGCN
ncbi:MAG TPA: hypothetical protein VGM06_20505 [Polyangiaceae bacterium]